MFFICWAKWHLGACHRVPSTSIVDTINLVIIQTTTTDINKRCRKSFKAQRNGYQAACSTREAIFSNQIIKKNPKTVMVCELHSIESCNMAFPLLVTSTVQDEMLSKLSIGYIFHRQAKQRATIITLSHNANWAYHRIPFSPHPFLVSFNLGLVWDL